MGGGAWAWLLELLIYPGSLGIFFSVKEQGSLRVGHMPGSFRPLGPAFRDPSL